MKKIVVSIMLAFIMMIGMAVPAYAYWPSQGTNPYPAGAGGDVTQFVENGVIYIAFTKNYNLTVMKKAGAANWEVLGGTAFTAGSYDKYGYVSNPSIYVYNGIPYVAYIEHYNYEYNPTVLRYNSTADSWDIVGSQQIAPDPQGAYSISSSHQIVADSGSGKLYYSADYVSMYVSASGTPYIAINENILDDDHPLLSTHKVVVMEYSGSWNTVGFAGIGDYTCKGTPAILRTEDTTYLAYYEVDTSNSPYKNYLVVQHPAALQSGPPTPEATGWGTNMKFDVHWSDKVQLRYDNGLYLCYVNANSNLEVAKRNPVTADWSSLGEILLDTSEDDYSMTVYDGIPYVAYMGYYDNTAHVAKYSGTGWENLYYNDSTALPPNVDDINLSNDNSVLYLTGTDMNGNLFTHYYNLPVNLEIRQNTGGKCTLSIGGESVSFSDPVKIFSGFAGGYTIHLQVDAWAGYEISSVQIDGTEVISSPCQTAAADLLTNRSHNIVIAYALPVYDAAAPQITAEPEDKAVNAGEAAILTVTASGTGSLSYQWYSNSIESTEGAAAVAGATENSYSVPVNTAGTTYYYCIVTNTDTSATGNQTAAVSSRIAKVTVADIASEPMDQILSAVESAIGSGKLKGNGSADKLVAFAAKLEDAGIAIKAGNKRAAVNMLESLYRQIDGRPSPKDLVIGEAAAEIALMIQNLISSLK